VSPTPPAFFINLSSRPDRLAHMQEQFRRIGITAERIEAVTPADIPESTQTRQASLPPGQRLSPNEIACSLSHRKAWQMMLDSKLPWALFLEDDAYLSDQLPVVLSDPALLEPGVDAIQFETHRTSALLGRPIATPATGVFKRRLMSSSLGGAAYLLTAAFARRLLASPEIDEVCQDSLIFSREGGFIYSDRIYQVSPALAFQVGKMGDMSQSTARSDLTEGRNERRSPSGRRTLGRRLAKLGQQAGHIGRILAAFSGTGEVFSARQVRLRVAADIMPMMDPGSTRWR
jgi:glycosyl transferase family 25